MSEAYKPARDQLEAIAAKRLNVHALWMQHRDSEFTVTAAQLRNALHDAYIAGMDALEPTE
jgi:hypothetical protein